MNDSLPCLDLLEATPAILRGLMSEISEEDARWKPAEDRFSIAEVLSHLSHSEGYCYRPRVDRFLSEEMPSSSPTTRRCTSRSTRTRIRRRTSRTSRTSGTPTSNCCGGCRRKRGIGRRCTAPRARSPCRRCCTNGRCTIWAHPANRGAGAGAQVPGRRGPVGRGIQPETMSIRTPLVVLLWAASLHAQEAPLTDHHQHLFSPALTAVMSPPPPAPPTPSVTAKDLVGLSTRPGSSAPSCSRPPTSSNSRPGKSNRPRTGSGRKTTGRVSSWRHIKIV